MYHISQSSFKICCTSHRNPRRADSLESPTLQVPLPKFNVPRTEFRIRVPCCIVRMNQMGENVPSHMKGWPKPELTRRFSDEQQNYEKRIRGRILVKSRWFRVCVHEGTEFSAWSRFSSQNCRISRIFGCFRRTIGISDGNGKWSIRKFNGY